MEPWEQLQANRRRTLAIEIGPHFIQGMGAGVILLDYMITHKTFYNFCDCSVAFF